MAPKAGQNLNSPRVTSRIMSFQLACACFSESPAAKRRRKMLAVFKQVPQKAESTSTLFSVHASCEALSKPIMLRGITELSWATHMVVPKPWSEPPMTPAATVRRRSRWRSLEPVMTCATMSPPAAQKPATGTLQTIVLSMFQDKYTASGCRPMFSSDTTPMPPTPPTSNTCAPCVRSAMASLPPRGCAGLSCKPEALPPA